LNTLIVLKKYMHAYANGKL